MTRPSIQCSRSVQADILPTRPSSRRMGSMEIDTVSIVGKEIFETFRKGELLQETPVQLQTCTGEAIPILGVTRVPVEHNDQLLTLPLIVTSGNGTPSLAVTGWQLSAWTGG